MPKLALGKTMAMAVGLGLLPCLAMPVLAQTSPNAAGNGPTTANMANTTNDRAPNGSLEKYHGQLRASELDGANVYNDQGAAIGTINDVLIGSDGKVQNVVISVGGFLGLATHYVAVPFNRLQIQPSQLGSVGPATGNRQAGTTDRAGATGLVPPITTTTANRTAAPGATTGPNNMATSTGVATVPSNMTTGAGVAPPGTTPNAGTAAANAPGTQYFSVVLPGATKDSLMKMPEFRYRG